MVKNKIIEKIDNLSTVILTGTLTTGSTTLTLNDSAITTESLIDVYTDDYTVAPTAAEVSAGKIIFTFEAQTKEIKVKVKIQ